MIEDLSKKIDLLVEMSGTSSNIDTLKLELSSRESEIARKKSELSLLSTSGNDKYFKASEKQVDENIKVSLELKIKRQKKILSDLQNDIDNLVKDEEETRKELEEVNEDIKASTTYIETLNSRLKTLDSADIKKDYEKIIVEENAKLDILNHKKEDLEKKLEDLVDELDTLNQNKEKLNQKLTSYLNNLEETKESLKDNSSYVDVDLKAMDEDRIKTLKNEIQELEKRRLEILVDPAMLASDAKKLILDDDITSALNKVKELVKFVKQKPLMDIKSGQDLENIINDELERVTEERDNFALVIDEKNYNGNSSLVLERRIKFLEQTKEKCEKEIEELNTKITKLDKNEFTDLANIINFNSELLERTKASLAHYDSIINNSSEDRSPKRKAILTSAYKKKEEEASLIKEVMDSYKINQRNLIADIDYLNEIINKINNKIKDIDEEIKVIKQKISETVLTKDVLEVESDKTRLKELDEEVRAIKGRKNFKQTPDEIFDEIEMYLAGIDGDDVSDDNDINLNFDYDALEKIKEEKQNKSSKEPLEDKKEELDITKELPDLESIMASEEDIKPDDDFEKVPDLPNLDLPQKNNKDLEKQEENPFIIGDYKDDEYIDIKDIFESEV